MYFVIPWIPLFWDTSILWDSYGWDTPIFRGSMPCQEVCQETDSSHVVSEIFSLMNDALVAKWICGGLTAVDYMSANELEQCPAACEKGARGPPNHLNCVIPGLGHPRFEHQDGSTRYVKVLWMTTILLILRLGPAGLFSMDFVALTWPRSVRMDANSWMFHINFACSMGLSRTEMRQNLWNTVKTPAVKPCIVHIIVLLCSVGSKELSA